MCTMRTSWFISMLMSRLSLVCTNWKLLLYIALFSGGPPWLPNEMKQRSPSGRISGPVLLTVLKLVIRWPRRARASFENGTWPFAGDVTQEERHSVLTLAYSEPGSIQKAL